MHNWIYAIILGIAGLTRLSYAIRDAVRDRRRAQLVRGVTRVSIAAAGEGQATCVVGTLVGALPLIAPFTGRPCVYWTAEIEERVGNAFETWRNVVPRETSARTACTIEDGSGRAIVELDGAEIAIDRSGGLRVQDIGADMTTAREWLQRRGLAERGLFIKRRYRFIEGALTADDPIAVVGVGVHEPDRDGRPRERGYRDGPPTRLRLASTARHPLFVTDAPDATREP